MVDQPAAPSLRAAIEHFNYCMPATSECVWVSPNCSLERESVDWGSWRVGGYEYRYLLRVANQRVLQAVRLTPDLSLDDAMRVLGKRTDCLYYSDFKRRVLGLR